MSVVVLTAEQRIAVARRAEPLLLSAAAGSGKTSVLVERFAAAVCEDGIAPSRILAITFTDRAAGELRARVRARLLERGDRDAARDTEAAFIGTFHGFCARLLRAHALAVGLDPAFAILDEGLAGRLRERAFATALGGFLPVDRGGSPPRSEAVDLLAAYGVERTRSMIEQVYAELRSRGQRVPRLPLGGVSISASSSTFDDDAKVDDDASPAGEEETEAQAARTCGLLDELLRAFALSYEQLKRARAAVDFDDLELLARQLLDEHEELRSAWCERFELLMVDEFQDTNSRQLGILAALERGNLFTVGDELQSIYGFRHADVSLFRARRTQLEQVGASLRLTRNFRSREAVLHVVNAVFAERFHEYTPLVPGREGQEHDRVDAAGGACTELPTEPQVELLLSDIRGWEARDELAGAIAAGLPHAQLWRQAEARMLAQRVAELVHGGQAQAGEVVVLLRAMGDLDVFERALQLQGLPTLANVGAFWGHQQIADLIAWLRAVANPLDEQAVYGALASPLGGCSLDCLALLAHAARERRQGIWQTALAAASEEGIALEASDRRALASFCARLRAERELAARHTIGELIERAISASGYREHVLALDSPERRLANVHKLLRLARRFQASEGRDLRAFLDHVEYLGRAAQVEPDAPVSGAEPDAVRLMSIHAAKGLEFPVVCLADLGRQPNTQTPDLLVDGERVGLRLVRLDGAGSAPALHYESLSRERREREAEEEDRILYVAMTRARERLLLSGAVDFGRWPAPRQGATPISWLVPALSEELPAIAQAAADAAVHELSIGKGGVATVRCLLNTPATVGDVLRLGGADGAEDTHEAAERRRRRGALGEQLSFSLERAPSSIRDEPGGDRVEAVATERPPLATMLSYTALAELERCGYRYYLERELGLPEQSVPASEAGGRRGLEARARGTLIHRLMELSFAQPAGLARDGAISAERVGDVAQQLGMRVDRAERAEIAELITAAAAAAPAARVAAASSVRREHPFAFSAWPVGDASSSTFASSSKVDDDAEMDAAGEGSPPLITGVIDLLVREADGGYLIVDYKSDRVDPHADLEALVEEEYAVQRELYALALLLTGAGSVEVLHWFLERPHEWVSARYRAHQLAELQARLHARLERAEARRYAVSSRPHRGLCLTCPGRGSLCSWVEAETLRKIPVQAPVR